MPRTFFGHATLIFIRCDITFWKYCILCAYARTSVDSLLQSAEYNVYFLLWKSVKHVALGAPDLCRITTNTNMSLITSRFVVTGWFAPTMYAEEFLYQWRLFSRHPLYPFRTVPNWPLCAREWRTWGWLLNQRIVLSMTLESTVSIICCLPAYPRAKPQFSKTCTGDLLYFFAASKTFQFMLIESYVASNLADWTYSWMLQHGRLSSATRVGDRGISSQCNVMFSAPFDHVFLRETGMNLDLRT